MFAGKTSKTDDDGVELSGDYNWKEVDRYLTVNPDNGFSSFYDIHSLYIWNGFLNVSEMKTVTKAIRSELGGIPYSTVKEDNYDPNKTVQQIKNQHIYRSRIKATVERGSFDRCMLEYSVCHGCLCYQT